MRNQPRPDRVPAAERRARAARIPSGAAAEAAGLARALRREPGLAAVGLTGLFIASLCLIAVVVRGTFIAPEGKLLGAVGFTFGVAVLSLTAALLLPLSGWSNAAHRS